MGKGNMRILNGVGRDEKFVVARGDQQRDVPRRVPGRIDGDDAGRDLVPRTDSGGTRLLSS